MSTLYVGSGSPEAIEFLISSRTIDLTGVTSVVFSLPNRTPAGSWAASIVEQSQRLVRARYVFASGGSDLPAREHLKVVALLNFGAVQRQCEPVFVSVVEI